MAVPDFLVIGAMKAGTTTLYRDLERHPDVFLPQEKEPETLVRFGDDAAAIARDYRSLFRGARPDQVRGEASTAYTKRPDAEGVAQRALDICGPGLRIVYLMRDPVRRLVSHYRHEYGLGETDLAFADALVRHDRYFDYGRYAWQIEPWLAAFPRENFLFLDFEAYVADRPAALDLVCRHVGIDPVRMPEPEEARAFNKSEGKPVARGLAGRLVGSPLYQRGLKRVVPRMLREKAMNTLLPRARDATADLSSETENELRARFADEPPPPACANRPSRAERP